jgi:hypothetical protein
MPFIQKLQNDPICPFAFPSAFVEIVSKLQDFIFRETLKTSGKKSMDRLTYLRTHIISKAVFVMLRFLV